MTALETQHKRRISISRRFGFWSERKGAQALLLILLTVAVLFARRPDQFLHPYIWVEDGVINLKAYAERGLASVIEPVQGYSNLLSKLIDLTAFRVSIEHAPEISLALTVAFTCAVVLAIALSPTHLRCPFLCAIVLLTIPTGPEVFAIPVNAFWWAGLLLVLVLLWDDARGALPLRLGYVALAGLSTPLIVPFAGLFALRAWTERRRGDYLVVMLAVLLALVQLYVMHTAQDAIRNPFLFEGKAIPGFIDAFAGYLIASERYGKWYSGTIVLILLAFACWPIRDRLNRYFILLVLAWLAICVAIYLRAPLQIVDPLNVGQRYLFYPFALLTWIMIWIGAFSPNPVRFLLVAGCVTGIALVFKRMTTRHDPVDWPAQIEACARSDKYALPIHFTHRLDGMLYVQLTGDQCRRMMSESLIGK